MNDRRHESNRDNGRPDPRPIPRDLPDQQAGPEEDPLDVVGGSMQSSTDGPPDLEIPDTDEAGTARRGAPQHGEGSGHPAPDESSA